MTGTFDDMILAIRGSNLTLHESFPDEREEPVYHSHDEVATERIDGIKCIAFFGLSTGEVYDESQCRDDILSGDVLICVDEKVVGFLCSAWPVAVTVEHGSLHCRDRVKDGQWHRICAAQFNEDRTYNESFRLAVRIARELGWEVDDHS